MNPDLPQEHNHSDHQPHTAPAESHVIPKSLWRRWMDWSGSFFVLSLLLHILIIGGAAFLVVQVVQARKEKLKFTAPPPAPPSAEHKVKPSKKTAAAAPAISKRITSTAANTSIALPTMEMNSSSPDIMSSVMSGMGAAGLGAGAAGGAGMAAMPLSGLTAFGFKGNGAGLKGNFYDFKQTAGGGKTDAAAGSDKTSGQEQEKGVRAQAAILEEFFKKDWDEAVLKRYFKADQSMIAPQIMMSNMNSEEATKAFGVDKQIKGLRWAVHYKGKVTAPREGSFRFIGWGDDIMVVRFNKETVLCAAYPQPILPDLMKNFPSLKQESTKGEKLIKGNWFQVERGKSYEMEVLVSEAYGGKSEFLLLIEERNPSTPYSKRTQAGKENFYAYPVFQVLKGAKAPDATKEKRDNDVGYIPETAPEPVIFQAK